MDTIFINEGVRDKIQYLINDGYKPVGDMEKILENYPHLIGNKTEIFIDNRRKIFDITGRLYYMIMTKNIAWPYILHKGDAIPYYRSNNIPHITWVNEICDYDEAYTKVDAYEIGWCHKCKCNPNCVYKKKIKKEN